MHLLSADRGPQIDAWRDERARGRKLEAYIDAICVEMEAKAREVTSQQEEHNRLVAAMAQLQVGGAA